jgi:hypothetical protein
MSDLRKYNDAKTDGEDSVGSDQEKWMFNG